MTFEQWWDTTGASLMGMQPNDVMRAAYDVARAAWEAALSAAAQPPADGALNTIAAMFHSAEEIEGPDGLAMMVDMDERLEP